MEPLPSAAQTLWFLMYTGAAVAVQKGTTKKETGDTQTGNEAVGSEDEKAEEDELLEMDKPPG